MNNVPLSGSETVDNIRIAVVLPAPSGPTIPEISPCLTDREKSTNAWLSPKDFDKFSEIINSDLGIRLFL